MARTKAPMPESKEVPVNQAAIAADFEASNQLAVITQGYSDDRDLLNQLLGQAQMSDAFAKFSVTVTTLRGHGRSSAVCLTCPSKRLTWISRT